MPGSFDVVLVKHGTVGVSETFIRTHARLLNAVVWDHPIPSSGNCRLLQEFLLLYPELPVLCEYGTSGARALPTLRALERDLFVYFHGYDIYSTRVLQEYVDRYEQLFDYSRAIFAVSEAIAGKLRDIGAPDHKIHMIPCGVDEQFFSELRKGCYLRPTFIFIGRFVEKKGLYTLIHAFALIKDKDAFLVLIGDGPLYPEIKYLIEQLDLQDRVEFRGWVAHEEIAHVLDGALGLVLPSLEAVSGDSEGAPVVLMEAAARGVCCLTTRHAGIPEVVAHLETGILVQPGSHRDLANGLSWLLENPDDARRLGIQARWKATCEFSAASRADQVKRILLQGKYA